MLTTEIFFGTYGANLREHRAPADGFPNWSWHWALGFNAVPALLALPLMFLSVESPRYLFLERGDDQEALKGVRAEFSMCAQYVGSK